MKQHACMKEGDHEMTAGQETPVRRRKRAVPPGPPPCWPGESGTGGGRQRGLRGRGPCARQHLPLGRTGKAFPTPWPSTRSRPQRRSKRWTASPTRIAAPLPCTRCWPLPVPPGWATRTARTRRRPGRRHAPETNGTKCRQGGARGRRARPGAAGRVGRGAALHRPHDRRRRAPRLARGRRRIPLPAAAPHHQAHGRPRRRQNVGSPASGSWPGAGRPRAAAVAPVEGEGAE